MKKLTPNSTAEGLRDYWYVLCSSRELGRAPLGRRLLGAPIVLFRDAGGAAHALSDRCAHRSAPLSAGAVSGDALRCPYHGWEFSSDGECARVPGLPQDRCSLGGKRVPSYPLVEQDGLVWVFGRPGPAPDTGPHRLPHLGERGYASGLLELGVVPAAVENVLENFMDTQHPAFVHPGLFYADGARTHVEVVVRQYKGPPGSGFPCGIEADFRGEPSPEGIMGYLFAERGFAGIVHRERYLVPTIHQLEYRVGEGTHFVTTQICTPETRRTTRLFIVHSLRARFPFSLFTRAMPLFLRRLIAQDFVILRRQEETIQAFGESRFSSTKLDGLAQAMGLLFDQIRSGRPVADLEIRPLRFDALI